MSCVYLLIQSVLISGGVFVFSAFLHGSLPVAFSGARDGSVQSDASSSPSEQSHLGQSHPGYPMGPQVSERIRKRCALRV